MAEPDPNNRPLYPTIRLADYGLAYRQNDDIRKLKSNMWGAGTENFSAPEVMSSVRTDPKQTSHNLVYPETDLFSVGCIILEMMRVSTAGYKSDTATLIDYEFPFPYKSFPYSDNLRDLAMDCVKVDVRTRPLARDVYKRTKHYADLWYGQINGPSVEKPEEAYAGQVLYSKDSRKHFETNMRFRWSYTVHNDWFHNNLGPVVDLVRTATDPGKANVPRGYLVAIGNGLTLESQLCGPPGQSLDPNSIVNRAMRVFNRSGKLLRRRDSRTFRRVTRPQNYPPKLDDKWKEHRVMVLEHLLEEFERTGILTDAQMEEITTYGRELLKLRYDSPTKYTRVRLRDLITIRNELCTRIPDPNAQRSLRSFADQMINYLSCQTATLPQFSSYGYHTLPTPAVDKRLSLD